VSAVLLPDFGTFSCNKPVIPAGIPLARRKDSPGKALFIRADKLSFPRGAERLFRANEPVPEALGRAFLLRRKALRDIYGKLMKKILWRGEKSLTKGNRCVTIWLQNGDQWVTRRDGMATAKRKAEAALDYKGHPLMRKDNLIYYGSMADKYIIMMQVLDTEKVKDLDVATRVSFQLQHTDPDLKSKDRVVKKSEKDGLYAALDVATVWLDRALASK
jgi:hypothetical protein